MKKRILIVCTMLLLTACVGKEKRVEQGMKQPVNCATAEGDIRTLQHEKAHVTKQIAAGVSAIAPAGAVLGIVTGTEGTKFRVAIGTYNKRIGQRIAEIKRNCGV
jgi:hypothetical protein